MHTAWASSTVIAAPLTRLAQPFVHRVGTTHQLAHRSPTGLAKAFANEEFKEDDQRVRASHILVKGDDDVDKIVELMGELGQRVGADQTKLGPVFAELARRESTCGSAAQGGDLGLFGPGKMVKEFDDVLFPEENAPPPGALLGPVVTEFGCHLILVTKREVNRDQVEEKLARND